jgi:hypothetical protein
MTTTMAQRACSPPWANGPLMARKIIERPPVTKPLLGIMTPTCVYVPGAGDENRTRTISLGSGAVTAAEGADLAISMVRSSRD